MYTYRLVFVIVTFASWVIGSFFLPDKSTRATIFICVSSTPALISIISGILIDAYFICTEGKTKVNKNCVKEENK
jgi:hypothetical protein